MVRLYLSKLTGRGSCLYLNIMLEISLIKQHLNIPESDVSQDAYLAQLSKAADTHARTYLGIDDEEVLEQTMQRADVQQAMLMDIATMFRDRESVAFGATYSHKAYDSIMGLTKNWKMQ